jgi:PTS system nitrogen regulatory IIA component
MPRHLSAAYRQRVDIKSFLLPERTQCRISVTSKKRAIEEASRRIAATNRLLDADEVYSHLIAREKLGTTALGHGIAIPHCRLDSCDEIIGAMFTLEQGIDFEAFDQIPVQVLFVLLVPTKEVDEHLQVLATLASRFDREDYRSSLFNAATDAALFEAAVRDMS